MPKKTSTYIYIYIIGVAIYTLLFIISNGSKVVLLDSSGLGSFLSGLFAPMVFLYLILGHKQQEEALNKTNQDLLQQLHIQKQMLEIQLADQRAREHAAKPIINYYFTIQDHPYNSKRINIGTGKPYESFKRVLRLDVSNSGEKVSEVSITCIKPFRKSMNFNSVLEESGKLVSTLSIDQSVLESYNENNFLNLEIELIYTTRLGITYKIIYEVQISSLPEDMHLTYGGLRNQIRCD